MVERDLFSCTKIMNGDQTGIRNFLQVTLIFERCIEYDISTEHMVQVDHNKTELYKVGGESRKKFTNLWKNIYD